MSSNELNELESELNNLNDGLVINENENESNVDEEDLSENDPDRIRFDEEDLSDDEQPASKGLNKRLIAASVATLLGSSVAYVVITGDDISDKGEHISAQTIKEDNSSKESEFELELAKPEKSQVGELIASDSKGLKISDEIEAIPDSNADDIAESNTKEIKIASEATSSNDSLKEHRAATTKDETQLLNVKNFSQKDYFDKWQNDLVVKVNALLSSHDNHVKELMENKAGQILQEINMLKEAQNQSLAIKLKTNNIKQEKVKEDKIPRLTNSQKAELLKGRTRLKGLKVVNTTGDGSMAIVKNTRNKQSKIHTFFDGEKLKINKTKTVKVQGIRDKGNIVLVGDFWFIDNTYEKQDVKKAISQKKKTKTKIENKPKIENKSQKKEAVSKNNSKPLFASPSKNVVVNSINYREKVREVAENWVFNGEFKDSKGRLFFIETPSGQWVNKRVGQHIKSIGTIKGVDENGNLIVGDKLIKKIVN